MNSLLSLLLVGLTIFTMIDAQCYQTPATTTTLPPAFSRLYHPCPRSQLTWNYQRGGPAVKCSFGPKGNACHAYVGATDACPSDKICCQDENGCNQCVDPCPLNPELPVGCANGIFANDVPVGCVEYLCN